MEELRLVGTRDRRPRRQHFQTARDMDLVRANGRIGAEVRPPDIPADRNRDQERIEHGRGQVRLVWPVGEAQVGHAPLLIVIAPKKLDPNGVADLAVESIGADEPVRLHRALDPMLADANPERLVVGREIEKFDPSFDAAAQPLELSGQDLLGDAFRQSHHEGKWRVENLKSKRRLARSGAIEVGSANGRTASQKLLREAERGENLEGPRFDHRGPIPHHRLWPLIDQDVRHAAASEFNCKHKARRTSADNENGLHELPPFRACACLSN